MNISFYVKFTPQLYETQAEFRPCRFMPRQVKIRLCLQGTFFLKNLRYF